MLAACGGGGGTDTSASTTPKPTPAPTPAISDNVFFSISPSAGVIATINKAGYLRSSDSSTTGQPLNLALGNTPMTGTGASSTGNGWLSASGTFVQSTVSLTLNSDSTTYTLKAQSSNGQVTNSKLQLSTYVVTPTLAALAGNFGVNPQYLVTVNGNIHRAIWLRMQLERHFDPEWKNNRRHPRHVRKYAKPDRTRLCPYWKRVYRNGLFRRSERCKSKRRTCHKYRRWWLWYADNEQALLFHPAVIWRIDGDVRPG
jgi:hypothetical protein